MGQSNLPNLENEQNAQINGNNGMNDGNNEQEQNDQFPYESIFDYYNDSSPGTNIFYNEEILNENCDEEGRENIELEPENKTELADVIEQTDLNNQKEIQLNNFDNILENDESANLNNISAKTFELNTINNNREKKKKKEKKEKSEDTAQKKEIKEKKSKKPKKEKKEKKSKKPKKEKKEKKSEGGNEKTLLGKKHGRKSKNEKYDDSIIHPAEELGNRTRIIVTSCNESIHEFIKPIFHQKKINLLEPTITAIKDETETKKLKKFINSNKKIRELSEQTLYKFYHDYTFPKKYKGCKEIKNIADPKLKKQKKLESLKEYRQKLDKIIEDEKSEKIKLATAILNLKFKQFLNVFLDYGYESYDNKKIEIDPKKYGFNILDLQEFTTYKQIRYKFSDDVAKQNHYREHLKKIINGQ